MIGSGLAWADRLAWQIVVGLFIIAGVALAIALLPLTWVLVLALGAIVVVLTLVHPQHGILLIVLSVPFGSLRQVSLGVMSVGATELMVALVVASWLMHRVVERQPVRLVWPPLTVPLVVFLGVLWLSLLGTTSLQHSAKEIVKWIEVLAIYVLVANESDDRWNQALVLVLLATGLLVALHGIYQFLFQVGPEGFILFGRFMRAHGTFEQPNPYAGYLGLTLPLAVGLVMSAVVPSRERVKGGWLAIATFSGMAMLIALVMSWSRGAWLGFAAAVAVMVLAVVARSGRAAMLAAVLAVILLYVLLAGGLALVPPSIAQRFVDFVPYLSVVDVRGVEVTDANFAVLERMAHWQSALGMWTDNPWLGVGIGNYEPLYERYALPLWPLPLGHAHNYYLNIAAEAGVLGLASYLLLWAVALLVAWRAARRAEAWHWGVALGVLGMLVHLSTHNLFDNLYVHGMYLQVAILLGIRTTAARKPRASLVS